MKSPISVTFGFVANGETIGTFAACAIGPPSNVAEEVRSPTIATTLSWVTNLRTMVDVWPAFDWLSSVSKSTLFPSTPSLALARSIASWMPLWQDAPYSPIAPEIGFTSPILTVSCALTRALPRNSTKQRNTFQPIDYDTLPSKGRGRQV